MEKHQNQKEKKGDHFVGDYYVEYSNIFKRQVEVLINQGLEQKEAERKAPIYLKAVDSLQKMGKSRYSNIGTLEQDEQLGL